MTGADERIKDVRIDADALGVDLMDGRTITVPLAWYPRLADASPEQLADLRERWDEIFRLVAVLQRGGTIFTPLRSDSRRQSQAEM